MRPLLGLLHLASPALPVGAFAYSQALEAAVEHGIAAGEPQALAWIRDHLRLVVARVEAPLWLRLHAAALAGDDAGFAELNARFIALRETAELRAEAVQTGASLARALPALGVAAPACDPLAFCAGFAWTCARLGLPAREGLAAYLWAWAENQVLAAVKLVPLGQMAGQRMLVALHPEVEAAVATAAALGDDDLGSAALGLAIESARHESQYSRLFRS
ncbi:urease accessory protein UreF [Derxia gummosa]|uniref:Urease accessory protein UreF n=1 Tax=Derxia gummosa DSM 723 TaxID=1121388 RepID=A0AC36KFD3_9BURK|nr:urease accessory UreF family protein [Derxia gummosa]